MAIEKPAENETISMLMKDEKFLEHVKEVEKLSETKIIKNVILGSGDAEYKIILQAN